MSAFVPTLRLVRFVTVSPEKLKEVSDLLGIPEGQAELAQELHLSSTRAAFKKPGKKKKRATRRAT
jgi:hypothetical protein